MTVRKSGRENQRKHKYMEEGDRWTGCQTERREKEKDGRRRRKNHANRKDFQTDAAGRNDSQAQTGHLARWKTHPDIIGLRVNMQAVTQVSWPIHIQQPHGYLQKMKVAHHVILNVLKTSISGIVCLLAWPWRLGVIFYHITGSNWNNGHSPAKQSSRGRYDMKSVMLHEIQQHIFKRHQCRLWLHCRFGKKWQRKKRKAQEPVQKFTVPKMHFFKITSLIIFLIIAPSYSSSIRPLAHPS